MGGGGLWMHGAFTPITMCRGVDVGADVRGETSELKGAIMT